MTARISGLRVRKRERTRAALVDAAAEMCLSRGYENTTVEQISAAVEVSPRTFSRYFASKDEVFVAVLDDVAEEIAAELRVLPAELGPRAAMRSALRAVFARAYRLRFHSSSGERIVRMVRVVTASEALLRAAAAYRGPRVVEAMAHRMAVGVEDRRLGLVMAVISATVVHAYRVVVASGVALDPGLIGREVDQAFGEVATYAADLDVDPLL